MSAAPTMERLFRPMTVTDDHEGYGWSKAKPEEEHHVSAEVVRAAALEWLHGRQPLDTASLGYVIDGRMGGVWRTSWPFGRGRPSGAEAAQGRVDRDAQGPARLVRDSRGSGRARRRAPSMSAESTGRAEGLPLSIDPDYGRVNTSGDALYDGGSDDLPDDDGFEDDCGLLPNGQCLKAGSEECGRLHRMARRRRAGSTDEGPHAG